jgi:processive rubber oxygenase RoxA-like protein
MHRRCLVALTMSALVAGHAWAADPPPIFVDQGSSWTPATRADFYGRDQGSRMIPLAWLQALKQPNGQPFLADSLARYGYLPNPANRNGLPVGFTASGPAGSQVAGMTCSACHTRQITAEGKTYRIDGGPAIADFQSFLADLDTAVGQVLASDAAFRPFAVAVLGSATPDTDDVLALRREVNAWYLRYHTLMTRALPKAPWGPARLDAVGMIFNRLTGLDLGPPPSFLIPDNIKVADAPVRYPFLWNAAVQDKTQWPGFADNGDDILGLARNLGEVFGVFGVFAPKKELFYVNFLSSNSANFDGLAKLEDLIKQLGPPKWPWLVDTTLAARGKVIYERPTAQGGCNDCHGIKPGTVRFPDVQTWATPIQDVGTDTREYDIMAWTANTGVLQGVFIPFLTSPLKETDLAFNVLATSVLGSITEYVLSGGSGAPATAARVAQVAQSPTAPAPTAEGVPGPTRLPPSLRELQGAFNAPTAEMKMESVPAPGVPAPTIAAAPPPAKGSYEARVMQGIWAAAPYLHNGSVPTLAELLKPAAERVKAFKIGPAYDTVNVGLAVEQTQFNYTLTTTDCSDRNSGNSRCGHEFGTQLTAEEKKALLEYLKTL